MGKLWIVVAGAVAVAATAGVVVVARDRLPGLVSAGPNRDLAPAALDVYAEARDLSGLWARMQPTEAWSDFAESGVAARVLGTPSVKEVLDAVAQISAKARFPLHASNTLKLIGRECSVGLAFDAAGGDVRVLVLTKLDVPALTKELGQSRADLAKLWDEMQRRTGDCDFVVTTSEHAGHRIASVGRAGSEFHATLLGDTLAVSTDAALLHASIDCRVGAGAGSIGRRSAFRDDVAALPPDAAAFEWYDLDALDSHRASLEFALSSRGAPAATIPAIHAVLDATRGGHSFARATLLEAGDLYQARWVYSKSKDLFDDEASPALRDVFRGDWLAYAEVRELGGVADAWERSALRRKMVAGEIGRELDRLSDELPGLEKLQRELARLEDPSGADRLAPLLDRFALQMLRHLAADQFGAMTGGEAAFAIDWSGDREAVPRMALAVRLDTAGRLALHAATGALLGTRARDFTAETCGSRQVVTFGKKGLVHASLVGDTLVVSTDADLVREAARSAGSKLPGLPPRVNDCIAALRPGWRGFLFLDVERALRTVEASAGARGSEEMARTIDVYRRMGLVGREIAVAAYVADDFGSIEIRTRMSLPEAKDPASAGLLANSEDLEPRCWRLLPPTTIFHAVSPSVGVAPAWGGLKGMLAVAGADVPRFETDFREAMGMDLETELLPALGREFFYAATCRTGAGGPPGSAPPFPAFVVGIEVKDKETVSRAVDAALGLLTHELGKDRMGSRARLVRVAHRGVEIVRLDLPAGAPGSPEIMPALALHDGFLLVSTEVEALRAIIDASSGNAKSLADSPALGAATSILGRRCASFFLLDWRQLLDQANALAPMIGQLVPGDEAPFPEFPENGDPREWKRRQAAYQTQQAEARRSGGAKVSKWIAASRLIEFVGTSSHVGDGVAEGTFVVKFSD